MYGKASGFAPSIDLTSLGGSTGFRLDGGAVHDGLGITEANWLTFMKIISDGMNEKKYPADVQDEFLAIWRSFRDSVVQK